jgi:hypothetical protein
MEAARMVQEPLNPAVLEAARQLLDRTTLRWPDTLQLAPRWWPAICSRAPRSSSSPPRRSCSKPPKAEGFHTLDPAKEAGAKQAAEKLNPEGDGGFNPRVKPID